MIRKLGVEHIYLSTTPNLREFSPGPKQQRNHSMTDDSDESVLKIRTAQVNLRIMGWSTG